MGQLTCTKERGRGERYRPQKLRSPAKDVLGPLKEEKGIGIATGTGTLIPT